MCISEVIDISPSNLLCVRHFIKPSNLPSCDLTIV